MRDDTQDQELAALSYQILQGLDIVEGAARRQTEGRSNRAGSEVAVAYASNPMASGAGGREIRSVEVSRGLVDLDLQRLRQEPFVARVVVENEEGERCVYYLARGMPLNESPRELDGKLANYRGPLGRLAEHRPGATLTIRTGRGDSTYTVLERVQVIPNRRGVEWDAINDQVETTRQNLTLSSLRDYLAQRGSVVEPEDFLASLEAQEQEEAALHQGTRRRLVVRMSLRDQAVLDEYQGDVFRLPVNRRLMLSGPPGTGKTTTLIKRVAQKSRAMELSDEERELIPAEQLDIIFRPNNWVMFTPTELLKLYVKEAFAQEGVPASDDRVRTWTDERRRLGRDVLRVLRSERGGRFMLADDERAILSDVTSETLMSLVAAFEVWFRTRTIARYDEVVRALATDADKVLASLASRIRRRLGTSTTEFNLLFDLVELHTEILAQEARLEGDVDLVLKKHINERVGADRELPARLARHLETLAAEPADTSDPEEESGDEERDQPTSVTPKSMLGSAIRAWRRALSARASELHDGRSRTRQGRNRQILDWLKALVPSEEFLRPLGAKLVLLERIRFLGRTYVNLIDRIPIMYQQFRRAALADGRWYRADAKQAIERASVCGAEVDVMLLLMLKNARRFLQRDGALLLRSSTETRVAVLDSVKGEYVTQVLVDEATDFSPIQLACMQELTHPELRSFFVCGDVRQRVTPWGMRNLSELQWVSPDFEVREISVGYRQSRRLAKLGEAIAQLGGASPTGVSPPAHVEDADVPPVLGENLDGGSLARWLQGRIREIERAIGNVPSIAIFVDGDARIDPLVAELTPLFAEVNLDVVGCKGGRIVGNEAQIRVFDVQHIKGLEFEAVFFIGIDQLAVAKPDLFDKFLFVGVTRAATYLGVSCEGNLPGILSPIRDQFSMAGWT